MNGNIVAAVITSVTTVACLAWTNRRQIGRQTRTIEEITAQQTQHIKEHVGGSGQS
jgi:hypothetical protein